MRRGVIFDDPCAVGCQPRMEDLPPFLEKFVSMNCAVDWTRAITYFSKMGFSLSACESFPLTSLEEVEFFLEASRFLLKGSPA